MGAETEFYRRHYGGGVSAGATPLDRFEREMLYKGKRYSLVADCLTLASPAGGCLVEIGCGGGEALLILSRRHHFSRVVGIDIASMGNGISVQNLELFNSNLNEKWPFADSEVDHLIAMMVIEHLFDPFHAFREIRRCISASGAAYVNLPLVTSWRNRIRLLFGGVPETSIKYQEWFERDEWDGNHLHYFSMKSIRDLALKCGLRITHVRGVGPFYKIKTMLPRLLAGEVTFRMQRDAQ